MKKTVDTKEHAAEFAKESAIFFNFEEDDHERCKIGPGVLAFLIFAAFVSICILLRARVVFLALTSP